jgi:hypothetical protein
VCRGSLHSSTRESDVVRFGMGRCNRLIFCALFADVLFFGLQMREFFISRDRFQEVDEGLVIRGGTDAHLLQFIGVDGVEGARDFGQVFKDPSHDEGGGAFALSGPDADSAMLEIGDGYGDVFHGHRATGVFDGGWGLSKFCVCFLLISVRQMEVILRKSREEFSVPQVVDSLRRQVCLEGGDLGLGY